MSGLEPLGGWGFRAAAGWCTVQAAETAGPVDEAFPWASVTKVVTAVAVWVAVEEGSVRWDDPAGPPGSTLRHLLSHASGLAPDQDSVLAPPGRRRIYSNRGIDIAADHVAASTGMVFGDYARQAVLDPLGMRSTTIDGSPARDGRGTLGDLMALAKELLQPRLVDPSTLAVVTEVAFPGLAGVLPGFGRHHHNDWGLGVEIRDSKEPHWTGRLNSASTFGHFGQSGSFLWVDPERGLTLASLGDRPFGPWALSAWPELADSVIGSVSES